MRRGWKKTARWIALGGAAVLGGGSVFAQGATSASAPASAPAVQMPFTQEANISPEDMVSRASDYLSKMQGMLATVIKLEDVARQQKDIIKLNCVDDKLTQLKQLIAIGQDADTSLHEDIARGDNDDRYHQYSRITIVNQQGQVLQTEAENCIGEDLTYVGQTSVSVSVDPSVPQGDPTLIPLPEPIVERPPVVSPF